MSEIVRRHYPVSRLPDDLREGLDPGSTVTVTVEAEPAAADSPRRASRLRQLFGAAADKNVSTAEAVARIRRLRDEWD